VNRCPATRLSTRPHHTRNQPTETAMPTTIAAHRLIEHRFGNSYTELRRQAAAGTGDPALAVVLSQADDLEAADLQARASRRRLAGACHAYRADQPEATARLLKQTLETALLEVDANAYADGLLDLLDLRLLLGPADPDQPTAEPALTDVEITDFEIEDAFADDEPAPFTPDDEELLEIARQATADLDRLSREVLRERLRRRGVRASNVRLGTVLRLLRTERPDLV